MKISYKVPVRNYMVTQSKIHKTVMKQIFWRLNFFLIFSRSFIDPNVPKENQNNPENMEETLVSAMKETIRYDFT